MDLDQPAGFFFDLDDPPGDYDPRASGVDLSWLRIGWTYAANGTPTGLVEASCTETSFGAACTLASPVSEGLNRFEADVLDFALNSATAANPNHLWLTWEVSVDSTPPTLAITAPASGSTVLDRQVPIDVSYADPGSVSSGLDLSSLEILANGQDWAVSCVKDADSATCQPTDPLPLGPVALEARIQDVAGGSGSAEIDLTVSGEDTSAPNLEILGPMEGEQVTSTTPSIRLSFTDQGLGIDQQTLSILANGSSLPVSCSMTGSIFKGSSVHSDDGAGFRPALRGGQDP